MWFPLRPRAERVLRVLSASLLLLCRVWWLASPQKGDSRRLLCGRHCPGKSSPALSKEFYFRSLKQPFRLEKFSKNKVLMTEKALLSDAFCPP